MALRSFAIKAKDDIEGYSEMLSGSEYYLYPSIREDVNVAMGSVFDVKGCQNFF